MEYFSNDQSLFGLSGLLPYVLLKFSLDEIYDLDLWTKDLFNSFDRITETQLAPDSCPLNILESTSQREDPLSLTTIPDRKRGGSDLEYPQEGKHKFFLPLPYIWLRVVANDHGSTAIESRQATTK